MKPTLGTISAFSSCFFWLASHACAGQAECHANATQDGSFFEGRTYKTHDQFPDVSTLDAFKRVYAFMVQDGWKIYTADKDLGVISGAVHVSGSEGSEAPLNAIVSSDKGHGSTVALTYKTSMGEVSGGDTVDYLCKVLESAASSP